MYSEGYRVTMARDYNARRVYSGPTFYTYNTGLRSAEFSDGRPYYRDGFVMLRDRGAPVQVLQRTFYGRYYYGSPRYYRSPVVRTYYAVPVYDQPVYVYRPSLFERVFYRTFWVPLAAPVAIAPDCEICPGRIVSFSSPVTSYSDPVDLLGDLQISSAFAEGAYPGQGGDMQAEVAEVRSQIGTVQKQVKDNLASKEVQAQVAANGGNAEALQQQMGMLKASQTLNDMTPVQVPDDVRMQVRQQVRLAIAQHQNGRTLSVADVVSNGYIRVYLFQANAPLTVRDADTGDECLLNSGDLIRFAAVPAAGAPGRMSVVNSRPGSCSQRQQVEVPLPELQEMLNGFYERVEENMKRVHSCTRGPGECLKV